MSNSKDYKPVLSIAIYPWLALGHLTSFLRIANELAARGHKVTYYLPVKTFQKLSSQNHFPDHLTFIPIAVPSVDGLPPGAETTNDASLSAAPLIMSAMEMTRCTIEAHLAQLKPDFVFYDFAYWIPELARKHGFKSVHYVTGHIARLVPFFAQLKDTCHPSSPIFQMRTHEAKVMASVGTRPFGASGLTLRQMFSISFRECDAIAVKSCKEMEGSYCDFVGETLEKPVLLAGPVVPKPPSSKLDEYFDDWLNGFGAASVVYCALGSECLLEENQFLDIVLGLELTGRPFLAALKPPKNYKTTESALPEGFANRVRGRGIIHEGWVQQQLILRHPSVGCFVTHCGVGSLSEAIVSHCQVVLMPQALDQFTNARQMTLELKIGVEVEPREDDGFFTRGAINEAVSLAMEQESEVGREVRANHAKWRELFLTEGLESSYIKTFIQGLHQLLK